MNRTIATWPTSSREPCRPPRIQLARYVRELQNYVERVVVLASGDEFTHDLLPAVIPSGRPQRPIGTPLDFDGLAEELVHVGLGSADKEAEDIHSRIVDRVEREAIAQALHECEGVQIKAAGRLGINRNTLHKKLKQYGLDGKRHRQSSFRGMPLSGLPSGVFKDLPCRSNIRSASCRDSCCKE